MHQNREQLPLVRSRTGGQIPEIGIEGQVTGGTDEADQLTAGGVDQADLPEAAFKGADPQLLWMGGLAA